MVIIDPMHNLFLGTAKHFLILLKSRGVLSTENLEKINRQMTRIKQHCPEDVGRIPLEFKINDHENLEGLTADQMKNWVICFSIPSLKDKIPGKVFDCWKKFVMACFHLCNRVVTIHDVQREPLSTNGKYLVRNLASK